MVLTIRNSTTFVSLLCKDSMKPLYYITPPRDILDFLLTRAASKMTIAEYPPIACFWNWRWICPGLIYFFVLILMMLKSMHCYANSSSFD